MEIKVWEAEAELDTTLGYEKAQRCPEEGESKNYRNGHSTKTVKTQLGEVEIAVPRDRKGEYEPQIIGKYSRNADGMEEKMLPLYAAGMSQRDIAEQIESLYGVEISPELVSKEAPLFSEIHPPQYIFIPVMSIPRTE